MPDRSAHWQGPVPSQPQDIGLFVFAQRFRCAARCSQPVQYPIFVADSVVHIDHAFALHEDIGRVQQIFLRLPPTAPAQLSHGGWAVGRYARSVQPPANLLPAAKAAEAIAALKALGRKEFVKTTETLDRAALLRQPAEFLEQIGAYIRQSDEFYYDVSSDEPDAG